MFNVDNLILRRDVGGEELIGGDVILIEFGADVGVGQTGANLGPILGAGDLVTEPVGEAVEAVLAVVATGDGEAAVAAGDDEGEDEEDEEEGDEDGHAEEVEGEEALLVPVGADEAREGDEEDEDAEEHHRPPELADALVVRLRRQPDPGRDDRDRAEERDEVQHRRDGEEEVMIWFLLCLLAYSFLQFLECKGTREV
ncbi:hypothetical protein TIFTF001_022266 [Ficus carica]|uniref:Uncharacterized protein n=1 Tax=Ficus carica TaxID=3494 RepID=A0AA88AHI0_FICCA|nr:hypothetical protein TIFTF001_022266 [Ficus carica]